jgi:hypothetical protein
MSPVAAIRVLALSLLAALLLCACTARPQRHVVAVEPLEPRRDISGRVLDDFADAELWTLFSVEGSVNPLRHQADNGALHLVSDSSAGLLWRQVGFDPAREPLLAWQWKVSRTFGTSNPLSPEFDNFPARLLVGFDAGWEGANPMARSWRRRVEQHTGVSPPGRAICYTFGGSLGSREAVDATFGDGRIVVINLRPPSSQAGVWHSEVRDVAADYRAIFLEDAPPVTAIALGCDSHRLGIVAEAWFSGLTVYGRDAYSHFASRLEPLPSRRAPLLTWLIVTGALLVAAGSAGVWFWLRSRDAQSASG